MQRCEPLLQVIGRRTFVAGTMPEAATAIKLANNLVLGCAMIAMAEGFSLVRKYGVETQVLYDVMTDMVFRTSQVDRTLFQSLLDARHIHGRGHQVVEDIARNPTSYDRLVMGSFILGRRMAEMTPDQKNVAVLLPNSIGCLLTVFGLHAFGRVPAMLNFSTGAVNMAAACTTAIIGIARKFNPSPAIVIREKNQALTGISASSAQSVATNSEAIASTALRSRRRDDETRAARRGETSE